MAFPGNRKFLEIFRKFPVPSIQEHPLPGPDLVPAFGTALFPVSFKVGKHSEITERFLKKKYVYFPDFSQIFSSDETLKH